MATVKQVYTRATMSCFLDEARLNGLNIERIDFDEFGQGMNEVFKKRNIHSAKIYKVSDRELEKRLQATEITIDWLESPNFLLPTPEYIEYVKACGQKNPYFQTTFYKYMRDTRGVLLTNGRYEGGKLTFDSENRCRMPAGTAVPCAFTSTGDCRYVAEAHEYVKTLFGVKQEYKLLFPVSRRDSYLHLEKFLAERFGSFGPYQDAFVKGSDLSNLVLFHSGISASLNCGLLDPVKILERTVLMRKNIKIASVEGFVRQLIGWREFVRFVYETKYDELISSNQLNAEYKVDARFYNGTTGIDPLDDAIQLGFRSGYLHHILRLMVVANFMTLLGVHPREMYKWFLEFALDSYDWVMVPNVYGMASYASALLSTKPYISSSQYIVRMSNYQNKGEWAGTWDALYNVFLFKHGEKLGKNGRMFFMLNNAQKKSAQQREDYRRRADKFTLTLRKK